MKDFLQSIFKSTEERIKNPFVGAFVTSWIIFNWKPILYLLFSDEKIKTKIEYISKEATGYTSIWTVVWFPLFSAIFYILILPFLSFLFEYILKYAMKWRNKVNLESRNDILELQIGVAKNEIKLEEEKTEFRERNSHNQMVENLNNQILQLQTSLDESRNKNSELSIQIQDQRNFSEKQLQDTSKTLTEHILKINSDLSAEKTNSVSLNESINEVSENNLSLTRRLNLLEKQSAVASFTIKRLQNPEIKILQFENERFLEYFNSINQIKYFDLDMDTVVELEVIMDKMNNKTYAEDENENSVRLALSQYQRYLDRI